MKIHFVGIGGIGISAVAQYYRALGHHVTGTNLEHTEIIEAMRRRDIEVFVGAHEEYVPRLRNMQLDLIVHNPAVPANNPEIIEAKRLGLKVMSTPELLGQITKEKYTIAVCGSHGKSTTTSMLAVAMINLGLDPTVIVGTALKEFGDSNFRLGKSKYLLIEADEYKSSFLNYWPQIIVCTNIEADHLDYFKTFGNIVKNFQQFVSHLGPGGFLVASKDGGVKKKLKIKKDAPFQVIEYSKKQRDAAAVKRAVFVPGEHNVSNAMAALEVCRILDKKDKDILPAIGHYHGAWRRFETSEIKIYTQVGPKDATFITDYAHHPTEILSTLQACKEKYKNRKIIAINQPHQYERTLNLKKEFIKAYKTASKKKYFDQLIITDIYDVKGRENSAIKQQINAQMLAQACKDKKISYLRKEEIKDALKRLVTGGEVILLMSAGDFYKLG